MPDNTAPNILFVRGALRQAMIDRFSIQEIKDICFDLGIDAEVLDGTTKSSIVRELLILTERRGLGGDLIAYLRTNHSRVDWPDPFSLASPQAQTATHSANPVLTATTVQHQGSVPAKPSAPAPPSVLKITSPITMELVRIPAGNFLMGSDHEKDENTIPIEQPQHTLYLPDFYIARTPVTNAQFAVFVKATGHQTMAEQQGFGWAYVGHMWQQVSKADWRHPAGPDTDIRKKANHPVVQVSWPDALAFCSWVGERVGIALRLPTEAEWEKAARGTKGRIYPWGDEPPTDRLCNFDMNVGDTTPVHAYPEGRSLDFGLLDMAGNTMEWTSSIWGSNPARPGFGYPYDPDDGREELDRPLSVLRVVRGGVWCHSAAYVRSAARNNDGIGDGNSGESFRFACSP
jgi:formylglycine-generating enzyme required for sulfatase activity